MKSVTSCWKQEVSSSFLLAAHPCLTTAICTCSYETQCVCISKTIKTFMCLKPLLLYLPFKYWAMLVSPHSSRELGSSPMMCVWFFWQPQPLPPGWVAVSLFAGLTGVVSGIWSTWGWSCGWLRAIYLSCPSTPPPASSVIHQIHTHMTQLLCWPLRPFWVTSLLLISTCVIHCAYAFDR